MDSLVFSDWVQQFAERIIKTRSSDYQDKVPCDPDVPFTSLIEKLPNKIDDDEEPFSDIVKDFDKIERTLTQTYYPKYFAHTPAPHNYIGILGEMMSGALGVNALTWNSAPASTELEEVVCDWVANLLNIPKPFQWKGSFRDGGGVLCNDSTDAFFTILCIAKYRFFSINNLSTNEEKAERAYRFTVYVSNEADIGIFKACRMDNVTVKVCYDTRQNKMTGKEIRRCLEEDIEKNLIPLIVVATMGSFSSFSFDDLKDISSALLHYPHVWLHCDAAFGGASFMMKKYEEQTQNLHLPDSIIVCAHNWIQVPFESTVLFLKNVKNMRETFIHSPLYSEDFLATYHPREYGIKGSRRLQAVKMWFVFRFLGSAKIKSMLIHCHDMRDLFASLLRGISKLSVVQEKFTFVTFQLKDRENVDNLRFFKLLRQEDRSAMYFPIKHGKSFAIRASINNEQIEANIIYDAYTKILSVISRIS